MLSVSHCAPNTDTDRSGNLLSVSYCAPNTDTDRSGNLLCLTAHLTQTQQNLFHRNASQLIQKLLVFERKILRRIFGPTKENQIWRIKTNEELR